MGAIGQGCVGGSGRSSHGSSRELQPEGISELEHVVVHDEEHGLYNGWNMEIRELLVVTGKVVGDGSDGWAGLNVSIHRDRVSCKKRAVGR